MEIPFDLLNIVVSFIVKPKIKLLDWIPKYKLNWEYLSLNPSIFEIDIKKMKIELTKRAKNIDFYK